MLHSMKSALGIILILTATTAFAFPKIDPQLLSDLNSSSTRGKLVTVIAMFQDKQIVPRMAHNIENRQVTQKFLMENMRQSQADTLKRLVGFRGQGYEIRVQPLWINNSMVITLESGLLSELVKDEAITHLYANREVHLVDRGFDVATTNSSFVDQKNTYGLEKLNIPALRAKFPELTGKGIRVGILDTGIDATHPDLAGRTIGWKSFISSSQTNPLDDHGHGTHVAGTVSGAGTSGTNIGVAPGVSLIIGKILSGSGSGTWEGVLAGMQWVSDPDGDPKTADAPSLVSNSWGGGGPDKEIDPMENPLCKAVANWAKLGILPVFANGNSGPSASTVGLPAACPDAFGVGATDNNDAIAYFSSRGPAVWKTVTLIKPQVSAPGVKVFSSIPVAKGSYKEMSGTSMATPHVAGAAALVFQANPKATVEVVQKLLIKGALDLGDAGNDNVYGWGRIDVLKTVETAAGIQ